MFKAWWGTLLEKTDWHVTYVRHHLGYVFLAACLWSFGSADRRTPAKPV
jgi:hypothetical protein